MPGEVKVRKLRIPTPPEPQVDIVGVMRAMERQEKQTAEAIARVDLMHGAVQRTEKAVADLKDEFLRVVGVEQEDGNGGIVATGLLGRMHRNEQAVQKMRETYRSWIAFGFGVIATVGSCALLVWWLIGDKVGLVLKGTGHQ